MTKRTLRNTKKIRKHKIFGTNIRDKIKFKQISNVLETAYKYGFRHFDTSPLYYSYNLFKKFLRDKPDIIVTTKVRFNYIEKDLLELRQLKKTHGRQINSVLFHCWNRDKGNHLVDNFTSKYTENHFLKDLKTFKTVALKLNIRDIGITNLYDFSEDLQEKIGKILKVKNKKTIIQISYYDLEDNKLQNKYKYRLYHSTILFSKNAKIRENIYKVAIPILFSTKENRIKKLSQL